MYTIKIKNKEFLDIALKKLKTLVINDGLMDQLYSKRAFETPKQKRERKRRFQQKLNKIKNQNKYI
jgi:ribosomal protein S21